MKIFVISLIALLLIVSGFFTVKAPIPNGLYAISSIAILLFAFPSYYFLLKSVGIKKAFLVLIILSVYAIVIEMIALKTGIPYGRFDYGERIGYKLFNLLPWTLSFAYVPLVLGTVTISQKIATSKVSVIGISTLLLVLIDLVEIYNLAQALLMPSFDEGFGLPVLEAIKSGCPVITSDRGSLAEVAGDAAIYVDPDDPESISKAIGQILVSKSLKNELVDKGLEQAKNFSIEKMMKDTISVYNTFSHEK